MSPPVRPAADRFWEKVKKTPGGCWEWTATKNKGYGYFSLTRTKRVKAHRWSWEHSNGPIPQGQGYHGTVIMHTCDNRACVNPEHLRAGAHAENILDRDQKGRQARQKGEAHGCAVLTESQVRLIRAEMTTGASQKSVARKYHVSRQLVGAIGQGKVWRHVV